METLTLYRGDSTKIDEFRFNKTNKHCYVGPGVYLTTSLPVAHSYRTKGASASAFNLELFKGTAKDRPEAFEKGFEGFIDFYLHDLEVTSWDFRRKDKKAQEKIRLAARESYRQCIEERRIVAEYVDTVTGRFGAGQVRTLKVFWAKPPKPRVGYVTKFEFPKVPFNNSVINVSRPIPDPVFWEIIFDKKVPFGTAYESREQFIYQNCHLLPDANPSKDGLNRVRRVMQDYGYNGFEYNGGMVIGGFGRHRAFCLWDDEYVNQHLVHQFT